MYQANKFCDHFPNLLYDLEEVTETRAFGRAKTRKSHKAASCWGSPKNNQKTCLGHSRVLWVWAIECIWLDKANSCDMRPVNFSKLAIVSRLSPWESSILNYFDIDHLRNQIAGSYPAEHLPPIFALLSAPLAPGLPPFLSDIRTTIAPVSQDPFSCGLPPIINQPGRRSSTSILNQFRAYRTHSHFEGQQWPIQGPRQVA